MPDLLPRYACERIRLALTDTPVVLVNGPRQCGKTTLVRSFASDSRPYFTLDDETVLAAAQADPVAFLRGLDGAVIDEVQRSPALLRTLKLTVDQDRRPGRFLLTGSANLLTLPQVADSLAGRMEVVPLLPLSGAEVMGQRPAFLRLAFEGRLPGAASGWQAQALVDAVLTGGYPEMRTRTQPERRRAWARDYVNGIVQRDIRDLADVGRLDQMPRLLRALAAHAGQLTNFSQLGGQLGLDDKTCRRYAGLLEQVFLVRRLEPWHRNGLKRLVKTPKLHFVDSGLLAALQGVTHERLAQDRTRFGALLETFVLGELLKQAGWETDPPRPSFFRTRDGDEVDVVLERDDGSMVAVEVKAAATVTAADFKGLQMLGQAAGDALALGVVLYDGDKALPFGDRLWAAPIGALFAADTGRPA
ncbi:MAG: ATP-binding protein [Pseudomonadota bacterium]